MRFSLRIYFIFAVTFIFFISFKILEPEIRADHPEHDDWGGKDHGRGVDQQSQNHVKLISKNAHGMHKVPNDKVVFPKDSEAENLKKERVQKLLKAYDLDWQKHLEKSPWLTAADWVTSRHVHPEDTPEMGAILREMSTRKIQHADVGKGGTQLKMTLILDGGQQVVFKPKWFERDTVIPGKPWNGEDRHNGEIAAFHLNRLMGFHIAPLAVGRTVDLLTDIKPVAENTLLKTFFKKDGNTCFYGKCYYCKGPETGICGQGAKLEGVVILWLPKSWHLQGWKHPWRRSYSSRVMKWERDPNYCYSDVLPEPLFNAGPRLLDLIDITIFDYLILNGDRHNYLTLSKDEAGTVLLLDNGKSFANPYMDDQTILAPVEQCCRLRRRTWTRLKELEDGILSRVLAEILAKDPISPILNDTHLNSLDRRLKKLLEVIETCIHEHGQSKVLLEDEFS